MPLRAGPWSSSALVAVVLAAVLAGCGDGASDADDADTPAAQTSVTVVWTPEETPVTTVIDEGVLTCSGRGRNRRLELVAPTEATTYDEIVVSPFVSAIVPEGSTGSFELPVRPAKARLTVFVEDDVYGGDLTGRSAGTLVIDEATCDPVPTLRFTIDADLAFAQPRKSPLEVSGGLSVTGD